MRERQRETEKDRETEKGRQRERQGETEKERVRQRHRERERERGRERERERERERRERVSHDMYLRSRSVLRSAGGEQDQKVRGGVSIFKLLAEQLQPGQVQSEVSSRIPGTTGRKFRDQLVLA